MLSEWAVATVRAGDTGSRWMDVPALGGMCPCEGGMGQNTGAPVLCRITITEKQGCAFGGHI